MRTRALVALSAAATAACQTNATPPGAIPAPPEAGVTWSSAVSTFALRELFLGDTTRAGIASTAAWADFGYDLDGHDTTESSTDVCTLAPSAPLAPQVDGTGGIDNAWGAIVVPILETAFNEPHLSSVATTAVDRGDFTLLVQITGLSEDPKQTASGLSAQVFVGASTSETPAFDATTNWPVRPSSVTDPNVSPFGATVRFSEVYVTNGTLVARGSDAPLVVPLELGFFNGAPLPAAMFSLELRDPVMTFVHTSGGVAAQGTIAGVLDTEALVAELGAAAGRISISLCGSAFDGVVDELHRAPDILSDGSNAPGVSCDGISVGIGFTGALVANPTTLGVDPVLSDPCADAGAD